MLLWVPTLAVNHKCSMKVGVVSPLKLQLHHLLDLFPSKSNKSEKPKQNPCKKIKEKKKIKERNTPRKNRTSFVLIVIII